MTDTLIYVRSDSLGEGTEIGSMAKLQKLMLSAHKVITL